MYPPDIKPHWDFVGDDWFGHVKVLTFGEWFDTNVIADPVSVISTNDLWEDYLKSTEQLGLYPLERGNKKTGLVIFIANRVRALGGGRSIIKFNGVPTSGWKGIKLNNRAVDTVSEWFKTVVSAPGVKLNVEDAYHDYMIFSSGHKHYNKVAFVRALSRKFGIKSEQFNGSKNGVRKVYYCYLGYALKSELKS